jgi:outer membrane protein OmpA-like peptidoglycan-associated protein
MRAGIFRAGLLLTLSAATMSGAWPARADDAGDALEGIAPVASTEIAFTVDVPLLTRESQMRISALLPQAARPSCYWLAQGRNLAQAEALRAGLGELDVPVERVVPLVREEEPAQARLYCDAPARVIIGFEPSAPTLLPDAEEILPLAVASYGGSTQMLTVRGFSSARESAEALKLGLDRAQTARDVLIEAGLPPSRMTIESKVEDNPVAVPRVEIAPLKN